MGVYLVNISAEEWFGADEGVGGMGATAAALNAELARRGLPPYDSVPEKAAFVPGSGLSFEEKMSPSMEGFDILCQAHLSPDDIATLCDWSHLIPLSLTEPIRLPIGSAYTEWTVIAGAPQVLAVAEKLWAVLDLPVEVPATCDNLDLNSWFMNGPAKELATVRPGPWAEDLDTAFYVALYRRAAQHSLRRGCPLAYV